MGKTVESPADARRDKYSGLEVKLNGRPARITGFINDFGTVVTDDGQAFFSWSWPAIARIVADDGRFVSRNG